MRILTLSSVFPNPQQPLLGLFVRERTSYVSARAKVRVVAPVPVSPLDPFARIVKPGFRPARPGAEKQRELSVDHPPFLCFPSVFKTADGFMYFASLLCRLKRLQKEFPFDLIDAHFAYPDGVAAAFLSRLLGVPFTVTLRGTEVPYSKSPMRRIQMQWVLREAAKVICVSASLAEIARKIGAGEDKIRIIPNGVDTARFRPFDRIAARQKIGLPANATVLLSVGGLVERKGYHRVIEILPRLKQSFKDLVYVIVGGSSVEGDFSRQLDTLVGNLGLQEAVRFEGTRSPDELPLYYSAADLFVLATSNEGWANVFLESMGCGTPVVTTDVGGNSEVVTRDELGTIVPFGDSEALLRAVSEGLSRKWDQEILIEYARGRSWGNVADEVISVFKEVIH